MAIYRFSGDSPIREVAFHQEPDKPPVALLAAREDLSPGQVAEIREKLAAHGWQCVAVTVEGRSLLQVTGFASTRDCIIFLADHHLTTETPQIEAEPQDQAKPSRFAKIKEFLRRYSLPAAGALNMFGDASLLADGILGEDKRNKKYDITAGSLYTLGGFNLLLFGGRREKPEQSLSRVSRDAAEFLQAQAEGLPEDSALAVVAQHVHHESPPSRNFLYRYAAQNTLAAYTAGAVARLIAGYRDFKGDHTKWGKLANGMSSVLFKTLSFVIPEKPKAKELEEENGKAKPSPLIRFKDWVTEKPLRIFGFGSILTELMMARETVENFKARNTVKKITLAITTVSYILADLLVAISSKNPQDANKTLSADEQRQVEALAAEVIAQHPKGEQEKLINEMSKHLAEQPEVKDKESKINTSLRQQVENMAGNPWAARVDDTVLPVPLNR